MAATLVTPVTCSKCKGSGIAPLTRVVHMGVSGGCYDCDMTGKVEGDPAAKRVAKAARKAAQDREFAVRVWQDTTTVKVRQAFSLLMRNDRARAEKCKDAVAAGDPRVDAALLAYAASL